MFRKREIKKLLQEKPFVESQETNTSSDIPLDSVEFLKIIQQKLHYSADFKTLKISNLTIIYIDTQVNIKELNQNIIGHLKNVQVYTEKNVITEIAVSEIQKSYSMKNGMLSILKGSVGIHIDQTSTLLLINIPTDNNRSLSKPENESQVVGPQIGFNESLATNISLIRRYITTTDLHNERFVIGARTNTEVSLLYIDGLASQAMVTRFKEKIKSIDVDGLLDSAVLNQLISDNALSIFPQMLLTERPDRICDGLLNGKLAILVEGSTMAILCPLSFIEFFESREDYNVRWPIASFIRLLRIIAMLLSVFFTALYVAALSFHYEVIPQALLVPLGESRSRVPFPPLFEAVLLEFIIELLREAGARLPTKVGQTMGIVGGIVIGTAAVQAGFTSNILIIIVALSALASFTTPSYTMGSLIRIIRFPLLFLAGFWGFYGIMFGFCIILIHLLRLTTLESPYLAPFYPPRFADWLDSIVRLPIKFTFRRPQLARPQNRNKYNPDKVK
ncbi:spore germination protein [Fictibacillus sp. 26RED30]|jgi:Bacillus/Clostridium GerA spore germination protein|uniref:spore germination protein n=1 Tax=Fictibacillus sp. 26RED30 TaxID=2745877 RepID=UPI0018CD7454|nr:spore germination protein [Fictibacillus sp. 26RED30]MBH0160540.1 spore germination protein [Fictibacillus sp. 26RED30]